MEGSDKADIRFGSENMPAEQSNGHIVCCSNQRNLASGLKPVRMVNEFDAGEITVCKSVEDGGFYTIIRVRERAAKLLFVEADAKMCENGGEYAFSSLESDGGALAVTLPYVPPRKMVDFAAPSCSSVEEKTALCLRLVRACMSSGIPWWLLYLCLTRENVQLCASGAVKFDMLIDLDNIDAEKNERDCARRCGALVREVLELMSETEKRRSNAYAMVQKNERNDSYTTLRQLYRNLEAVYMHPSRSLPLNIIFDWCKTHMPLLLKAFRVAAVVFTLVLAATLLKSLVFSDVSFPSFRYEGLDRIGEINLGGEY